MVNSLVEPTHFQKKMINKLRLEHKVWSCPSIQVKLHNKIEKAEPLGRQIGSAFLLTEGGRKLTNQGNVTGFS